MAASLTSASITWDTHDHGDPLVKCCSVHISIQYIDAGGNPASFEYRVSQVRSVISVVPVWETAAMDAAKTEMAVYGIPGALVDRWVQRVVSAEYH